MSQKNSSKFDPDCRDCPRLAGFLDQVALKHPDYHARPVAPFGDDNARLLIVGLAPGMHGANASGRPFTGDHAGILLYKTLFEYGFSNQPESVSRDDELQLSDCRITNAVKCLPPQNKPLLDEVKQCNHYLRAEIDGLPTPAVILALGKLAHDAVLRVLGMRLSACSFGHAAMHAVTDELYLIDSYHCSRYNTQTRRLTPEMFGNVFRLARQVLDGKDCRSGVPGSR
jgi:uracil-DNA glycosylase family 4